MSERHDSNLRLAAPILDRIFDPMWSMVDDRAKGAPVKCDYAALTRRLWRIVVDWKESASDAKAQGSKRRIGDEEWVACECGVVYRPPAGLGLLWLDLSTGDHEVRVQPDQTCLDEPDLQSSFGKLDFAWIMARALRGQPREARKPNRDTKREELVRLIESKGGRVKLTTLHRSMRTPLSIEKYARQLADIGLTIVDDGGIRYVTGGTS